MICLNASDTRKGLFFWLLLRLKLAFDLQLCDGFHTTLDGCILLLLLLIYLYSQCEQQWAAGSACTLIHDDNLIIFQVTSISHCLITDDQETTAVQSLCLHSFIHCDTERGDHVKQKFCSGAGFARCVLMKRSRQSSLSSTWLCYLHHQQSPPASETCGRNQNQPKLINDHSCGLLVVSSPSELQP